MIGLYFHNNIEFKAMFVYMAMNNDKEKISTYLF
jgi:hypothetical protein